MADACVNRCPRSRHTFMAECMATVEDGTAKAKVYFNCKSAEDADVVFRLLRLTGAELRQLQSTCRKVGGYLEWNAYLGKDETRTASEMELAQFAQRLAVSRQLVLLFKHSTRSVANSMPLRKTVKFQYTQADVQPDGERKTTTVYTEAVTQALNDVSLTAVNLHDVGYTEKAGMLLQRLSKAAASAAQDGAALKERK